MNTNKPFPLPTGYFGIPLGLAALSLAWTHLAYRRILPMLCEVFPLVLVNSLALRKLLPDYRPLFLKAELSPGLPERLSALAK